jgi:uncharacterized protein YqeY
MNLQEQVNKDITTAMKNKEKEKLEALRFLKSLFIQNNTAVKPTDDQSILISHVKKLQESLVNFPEGSELKIKTQKEIEIISQYMPKPLSQSEVEALITQIKSKLTNPNMGEIMKELTPQIKGKFDGKLASDLVKNALA